MEITIQMPDGSTSTILKGQKVLFAESGNYTLTYTAYNLNAGNGLMAEKSRKLTVTDGTQAEVVLDE